MDKLIEAHKAKNATIRPFTEDSLEKIKQRIATEKKRAEEAKKSEEEGDGKGAGGRPRRPVTAADRKKKAAAASIRNYPNPALETGKKFPDKLGEFPRELYGQPIEDLDEFYNNKYVSLLLSLFSATTLSRICVCLYFVHQFDID